MGDFEVFLNFLFVLILGIIIYNVINSFLFRDILRRFGIFKTARKDFYECGFRPQRREVIRLPMQFLLIAVFFLLYDIELIFLFPYVSGVLESGLFDFGLILFFFLIFSISIVIDYDRHALY
jgi:NADH-quinone oxidoreductase subunit A